MFDKLIELIVASLETFQFWTVINPYERAVLIRLGQFKEELAPGFHWRLPFHIDAVHSEHVVPRTERISGLATTTADGGRWWGRSTPRRRRESRGHGAETGLRVM